MTWPEPTPIERIASCHCGRLRAHVLAPLDRLLECSCSICTRKGFLHWIVPASAVRLVEEPGARTTYRFGTGTAAHYFCAICGCAPYYVPRSDPGKLDVNARCLEGVDLATIPREPFDGRDWERAFAAYDAARAEPDAPTGAQSDDE